MPYKNAFLWNGNHFFREFCFFQDILFNVITCFLQLKPQISCLENLLLTVENKLHYIGRKSQCTGGIMINIKKSGKTPPHLIIFLLILGISAWLRLYNLKLNPGWYHDECVFVDQSWNLIHGKFQWEAVSNTFLPRLPLPHLLTGALMLLFGKHLLVIRTFYALCGISIVVILYFTGVVAGNRNYGLLYATVYAIMPYTVLYNRWGFTYNLVTALSAGGFLLMLIYLKDKRLKWLWLAVLCTGLALVSEIISIIVFVFVAISLLFLPERRKNFAILSTAFIPLFLYLVFMWIFKNHIFIQDTGVIFQKRAVESGFLSGFVKNPAPRARGLLPGPRRTVIIRKAFPGAVL
ncbi:MAG: hypothetical protein A2161_03850 [Candidatus Schekmanbacteria bacterium RBG_13_48_7]|uniref:Glycosyltransferase RgtA/B/C/D-like domain-containing protein n=1 Tax=Candidatus Schekmanbacteria bacterium RBG_13_48_7 TaxID=1817878 RepID=A0A1F7RZL5_9BACT|nr:MAG: hypothetical protein A2161_03850 [Candidatus Schekmanbacteria bacterium RBG_13_48_7]